MIVDGDDEEGGTDSPQTAAMLPSSQNDAEELTRCIVSRYTKCSPEEEEFERDYIDRHHDVDKLVSYIQDKIGDYYGTLTAPYYSPYITIAQSSGYGKSRLVTEVGKRLPMVYFCFRQGMWHPGTTDAYE